jgi:AraC-like DNA-binding protein
MTATATILAKGEGWHVADVVCTAAAGDRPFEEQHPGHCVAAVTGGVFRYRAAQGTAMLTPGALLLGNPGTCYECGHEHGAGDRCLSFHFAPGYFEAVAVDVPGAARTSFATPRVPPSAALAPLMAAAEAMRGSAEAAEFEELGLRMAGAAIALASGAAGPGRPPSRRDQKRVAEAVRLIETGSDGELSLSALAGGTATSPYHFLRTFRAVAGMTPYQFLLRTRLHRAAVRLRQGDEPVSTIAFEAGFNDLSTFNRRFRGVMGMAPAAYRFATRKASRPRFGARP